jgi:UPF0716 protein FxsA
VLPVLLLLFIVVPIAELAVIIQVGQSIGLLPTIVILLADSIIGAVLLRSQGRATWRHFTQTLRAGRPPARELLDGALVLVGGALLLTPGFITDITGFLLLLPPTRAVIRKLLSRRVLDRMMRGMVGGTRGAGMRRGSWPPGGAGARPARHDPGDIDGTAVDTDPPPRLP